MRRHGEKVEIPVHLRELQSATISTCRLALLQYPVRIVSDTLVRRQAKPRCPF